MRLIARFAGIVLLLAAAPSGAAPLDPFPDQPGALSAEEIQAASSAMRSAPGADPALPLVATGKRSPGHFMPMYALFASPPADYSDRVRMRKLVICNFIAGSWRCGAPLDEFRMSANGIEHAFTYQVIRGEGNRQRAVDAAGFLHSPCFSTQYAAIGGTPFAPSPDADYVNTVIDEGTTLRIVTGPLGDGDSYVVEKTDQAADNCGFRLMNARIARSGVQLPAGLASEVARRATLPLEKPAAAPPVIPVEVRGQGRATLGPLALDRDNFAIVIMYLAMVCGVLALLLPRLAPAKDRYAAARMAGGLAGACTLMAASSAWYIENYFRIELLVNGALVLLAWLNYGWLLRKSQ